jgi:hypothetical protein
MKSMLRRYWLLVNVLWFYGKPCLFIWKGKMVGSRVMWLLEAI